MAKKAKNKHAASAAFFQRVNGPDFDIKKTTEPRGGSRGGGGRGLAPGRISVRLPRLGTVLSAVPAPLSERP